MHQAVQHLLQDGKLEVELENETMGGFPVDRSRKHFSKKVLAHHPDVIVLQFGSIDASAPLRRGFGVRWLSKKKVRSRGLFNRSGPEGVSPQPPAAMDLLKWQLRSLASEILLVPPRTPLDSYLTAILNMVDECREAGSAIVVLSPFVMGGGRGNRFAQRYTRALEQQLSRVPGAWFLDAHSLLSQERRSEMLLRDGFHLSARAHQKLGLALGQLLVKVAQRDHTTLAKDQDSGQPK
jgi:lysophospholipase L1-like esterase